MANKPAVFQRLIGLETEYALLTPNAADQPRLNRHAVFHELVAALRTKIPCAAARNMKEGVFHAAGGAVWFETERPALGGGLIEGSTPECRSPRQLLAWQRAQDEMLAEAADTAFGGAIRLIKNDRDAAGNVYGTQENYEATLASGWRLILWRTTLLLLPPLGGAHLARSVADGCIRHLLRAVGDRCVPGGRAAPASSPSGCPNCCLVAA